MSGERTGRRRAVAAVAALGLSYGVLVGLVALLTRTLMYPAPLGRAAPALRHGTLLRIPGEDGRTVHAFHVPASAGRPTIVHFHGNGEALGDQIDLAEWFRDRGVGFYAVEYPGYGLSSDASPNERAIYADAETALRKLRDDLRVPDADTVLQGQSLGTGVAVEMARRGHGARLVLVSPYTSMVDMARRLVPVVPAGLLVKDRYDTASKAPGIRLPTLIIHGVKDSLIPVEMAHRLSRLFPRATLRLVPEAHHNDVWHTEPYLIGEIAAFATAAPEAGDASRSAR